MPSPPRDLVTSPRCRLPRYAAMTAGSLRTSSGVPCAMTLPNSSTKTSSQTPSTSPMSWSTSSIAIPPLDDRAQLLAELPRSRRCRGRRRARRGSTQLRAARPARGPRRRACAGPATARWACASATSLEADARRAPRSRRVAACVGGRRNSSVTAVHHRRAARGHRAGSPRTVRSSNSSTLCHVRARPAPRAGGGRSAGCPCRRASTCPAAATKPLIASMNVVLPAPLGPISPTSWPSPTSRSTSTRACTPPKLTDSPPCHRSTRGLTAGRSRREGGGAATRCLRRCELLPRLLGGLRSSSGTAIPATPSGEEHGLRMSETPPMSRVHVPEMPMTSCVRVREQALGRDQAGEDRPGRHRDAAEVGEGDEPEPDEGAEPVGAHRAEVVGVLSAGDAAMNEPMPNAASLTLRTLMPARGRSALVGADGEHALTESAARRLADEQAAARPAEDAGSRGSGSAACRRGRGTPAASRSRRPNSSGWGHR